MNRTAISTPTLTIVRPRALGYVRVSTEEQAAEGISLDAQRAKLRAYAELHDIELVDVVADEGKSGKSLQREGLQRAIRMITGGEVSAFVVYKLDRLSRKVLDTLYLIELMEAHGVAFHSLTERIDTHTAQGRFFLNIMASLAQMERDLISERTRDALRYKAQNGERVGLVKYGYRLDKGGRRLIPDTQEQEVIRIANTMYQEGLRLAAICRALEARGLTTRNGRPFDGTQVRGMIEGYAAPWKKKGGGAKARFISVYEA